MQCGLSIILRALAGSGVSQMKHVLASRGEDVLAAAALCFSIEAGAVKVLGIVLVVVGRLNVGREGAMVQIAGCVAHLLARKVGGLAVMLADRTHVEIKKIIIQLMNMTPERRLNS